MKNKLVINKFKLLITIIILFAAVSNNYSAEGSWEFTELSATKKEVKFSAAYRFHLIVTLKNISGIESKPEVSALIEVLSNNAPVYQSENVIISSVKNIQPGEEINLTKSLSRFALKNNAEEPYVVIKVTIGSVSKTFTVINSGYLEDGKQSSGF